MKQEKETTKKVVAGEGLKAILCTLISLIFGASALIKAFTVGAYTDHLNHLEEVEKDLSETSKEEV